MKLTDLVRHLLRHGCTVHREGGNHTIYINLQSHRSSAVPRHREINDFLARKICDDLQIPRP